MRGPVEPVDPMIVGIAVIDRDKDRATCTDYEGLPPPLVVLVAQLHVGADDGK